MKAIRLTLVVGAVLLYAGCGSSHFVKAALGFRLGYSPAEKGYGEKLTLNSGKKGVGVQLLGGVNNGGKQLGGEARVASASDIKASGSSYGVGVAQAQGSQGQGRSIANGPLEALGNHGAVRHLRILGLNLYLGGRAAQLGQGLGLVPGSKAAASNKPLLGGLVLGGQQQKQQQQTGGSNLVSGHSPLQVLSKPFTVGAGVGAKSNLLTNLGPAPNGGKNIGGIHGIRIAAGTPGFGLGMNLGLKHAINTKSPLGQIFGLGGGQNSGGGGGYLRSPGPYKFHSPSVGKVPYVSKGGQQDQVYIPGAGILRGHGHDNNAYSNAIEGLESSPQMITAAAPLQLTVLPIPRGQQQASQINPQGQQSQQHLQQAAAPQQHQGLHGPLSIPSTYRNPFLSFLRPSILRPTPLQYTFNHPQAQQTGPIRQTHSHSLHHHPRHHHPQIPQRPRQPHHSESPSLFSGWSTLFPLGRHKTAASTNANSNYFVNPLLPNGQPLAKLQASLRPGQAVPLSSTAQQQVPFVQQAQHQQNQQLQHQQQHHQPVRGFHPQYTSPLQSLLGLRPHQPYQQYFPSRFQRPAAAAAAAAAPVQSPATAHQPDYSNFFSLQPFQNPQASPFLNPNAIQQQPAQASASPNTGSQTQSSYQSNPQNLFTLNSNPFAPPPGFQYSHSTHSQPVKMTSFTIDADLGANANQGGQQTSNSNPSPLYGPLGRRLKKTKKPRTDVIIKKKDEFAPETPENSYPSYNRHHHDTNHFQNFNPFHDMETSASTNALTLTSSLGQTSWTPIVRVEIPSAHPKSLAGPSINTQLVKTTEKKVKSLPLKSSSPSSSPSPVVTTTTTTTTAKPNPSGSSRSSEEHNKERGMIFKRRNLKSSGEQITSPAPSSPAPTTSSPAPIKPSPLISVSSNNSTILIRSSALSVTSPPQSPTTTLQPPSSSSPSPTTQLLVSPSTESVSSSSTDTPSPASSPSPVVTTLFSA